MKSTKLILSNEKTTVSLPTVDDLKNGNTGFIGTGQALIYFPDINKLGTGEAGSNNQLAPGTSAQHVFYVQDYGQAVAGLPGNAMRPYRTIQSAIDAAAAGDTVVIRPGGTSTDYLGRASYGDGVSITKNLNIIFEGGVASGYWVFGAYPGSLSTIQVSVKNGIWTNGLAVIGSNGQQCRYYFNNCSFEDKTTIFQLVPSGFEQSNNPPGLDKQYYTNCRFLNTNPVGGDGVFKMQSRDDATPTQHIDIILQDCQVESVNTPIATQYASIYTLIHLRGSTALIVDNNQALQTVARANSSIVILDSELFIDERVGGSGSGTSLFAIPEYVVTASGAQSILLPAGATGVLDLNILEVNGGVRPIYQSSYSVANGLLAITAEAAIQVGDKIEGSYYKGSGSSSGGSSGGSGSNYTLPVATASVVGGVKIGSGINVASDGTISVSTSTGGGSPTPSTAIDYANEIAVTANATGAVYKAYVLQDAAPNTGFTFTLPTNATPGQALFVRVDDNATGLFTIAGIADLKMWATESATFRYTAQGWRKAADFKPMRATISAAFNDAQAFAISDNVIVNYSQVIESVGVSGITDIANHQIVIKRTGKYVINTLLAITGIQPNGYYQFIVFAGTHVVAGALVTGGVAGATAYGLAGPTATKILAEGTTIYCTMYSSTGGVALRADNPELLASLSITELT